VLSLLFVEIEAAFAEKGETDGAELGVQIAEGGFAVRALLAWRKMAPNAMRVARQPSVAVTGNRPAFTALIGRKFVALKTTALTNFHVVSLLADKRRGW
jgi:hypothetical protein